MQQEMSGMPQEHTRIKKDQVVTEKGSNSPIFSITIEIAQEKHSLHIFKNDSPDEIAKRFCIQNNWDLACAEPVSAKILQAFEQCLSNPNLVPKLRKKLLNLLPVKVNLNGTTQESSHLEGSNADNEKQEILAAIDQKKSQQQVEDIPNPAVTDKKAASNNSKKYFCYDKISSQIQQQAVQQIQAAAFERMEREKSKRSLSLDNCSSNLHGSSKFFPSKQSIQQNTCQQQIQQGQLQQQQQQQLSYQQQYPQQQYCHQQQQQQQQQQQNYVLWKPGETVPSVSKSGVFSSTNGNPQQAFYQNQEDFHLTTSTAVARSLSAEKNSRIPRKIGQQIEQTDYIPRQDSPKAISVYDRGVYYLGKKQDKIEKFKQNRYDNELNGCTFAPKTNTRANDQLLQHRDKIIDPYDQLYQNGKTIMTKKALIKDKLQMEEEKELSFKPILNPLSQLIVKVKREDKQQTVSELEAQKVAKISAIQQEMLRECTFHPQISKLSEKISKTTNPPAMSVYDRLYSKAIRRTTENPGDFENTQQAQDANILREEQDFYNKNNVEKANGDDDIDVDPSCMIPRQQPSFDNNESLRNNKENAIQQMAALNYGTTQNAQQLLPPRQSQSKKLPSTTGSFNKESSMGKYAQGFSPNKNSAAIFEKKKKLRFEEIFFALDGDQDGLISAIKIDIQSVPIQILVIIAPLLYELEDMQIELNQLQFVEALELLFRQLSLPEKNNLLLFDTYQKWQQEKHNINSTLGLFQPNINPLSDQIAQISRPNAAADNLYDLYKQRDRISEEKLLQKRREKENQISAQCTFQPEISTHNSQDNSTIKEKSSYQNCSKAFSDLLMKNHIQS